MLHDYQDDEDRSLLPILTRWLQKNLSDADYIKLMAEVRRDMGYLPKVFERRLLDDKR